MVSANAKVQFVGRKVFWLFSTLLIVAALGRLSWLGWHGALCREPVIRGLNRPQLPVGPCWEYWTERYQTGLGAAIALLAAYLAWNSTKRQLTLSSIPESKARYDAILDVEQYVERVNETIGGLLQTVEERMAFDFQNTRFASEPWNWTTMFSQVESSDIDIRAVLSKIVGSYLDEDTRAVIKRFLNYSLEILGLVKATLKERAKFEKGECTRDDLLRNEIYCSFLRTIVEPKHGFERDFAQASQALLTELKSTQARLAAVTKPWILRA